MPPGPVSQACAELDSQIEGNPDKFLITAYEHAIAGIRARVSKLISVEPDEVAIVPNTTHAVFTVLSNIEWKAGDILIKSE